MHEWMDSLPTDGWAHLGEECDANLSTNSQEKKNLSLTTFKGSHKERCIPLIFLTNC